MGCVPGVGVSDGGHTGPAHPGATQPGGNTGGLTEQEPGDFEGLPITILKRLANQYKLHVV